MYTNVYVIANEGCHMNEVADKLHFTLVHTVTEYDRKQSTKRGYNIYALSQYLNAIEVAEIRMEKGRTLREALVSSFNGRLLDRLLKAVGEPTSTVEEQRY